MISKLAVVIEVAVVVVMAYLRGKEADARRFVAGVCRRCVAVWCRFLPLIGALGQCLLTSTVRQALRQRIVRPQTSFTLTTFEATSERRHVVHHTVACAAFPRTTGRLTRSRALGSRRPVTGPPFGTRWPGDRIQELRMELMEIDFKLCDLYSQSVRSSINR